MRKKIKVSIPRLIKEIIELDVKYFGYTREKLCNIILQELGYQKTIRLHEKMEDEEKTTLTFNLYEKNTMFFTDMLRESGEDTEREFLRRVFSTYINLHPSLREKLIRKDIFLELEKAKKRNKELKICHNNQVLTVKPLGLERDSEDGYNYLKVLVDKNQYLYKIKDISFLKIKY
nr:hypothetical protein [uncultured Cetobacterium sp.]